MTGDWSWLDTIPCFRISANHHDLDVDGYAGTVHAEVRYSSGRRYWYRRWRDHEGRQRKQYIRRGDLARVVAGCVARRRFLRRSRAFWRGLPVELAELLEDARRATEGKQRVT